MSVELREALAQLGEIRFVVPASSIHGHLFMEEYQAAYPAAELFSAPGLGGTLIVGDLCFRIGESAPDHPRPRRADRHRRS